MPNDILREALRLLGAGLSVLPAVRQEKRPALSRWRDYSARLPTPGEVHRWFGGKTPPDALCIACGAASGNLEMLDFDCEAEAWPEWQAIVADFAPDLLPRLVIETSQSGGKHVIYRCVDPIPGSQKLTQRTMRVPSADPVMIYGKTHKPHQVAPGVFVVILTLIETRGTGGLFLCHPTAGYVLEQGDLAALPVITADERDLLIRAARALDAPRLPERPRPARDNGALRPGDDYNARGDVRTLLQKHGWTMVRGGVNELWRRPGKDCGWSATLREIDGVDVFYVHSSNAAPFAGGRAYDPVGVLTALEHGGDVAAAAADLRRAGYGDDRPRNGVDLRPYWATAESTPAADGDPPAANGERPIRRLRLRSAADAANDAEAEGEIEWVWPGRVPCGGLTLFCGRPGCGKSLVSLDLAARLSRGDAAYGETAALPPCDVLLSCTEDRLGVIVARLRRAGADLARVHFVDVGYDGDSDGFRAGDLKLLESRLGDMPGAKLLVIDPLADFVGSIDTHAEAEVRANLLPLAKLAQARGLAIVGIAHDRKSGAVHADDRVLGSRALSAIPRSILHFGGDPVFPARTVIAHGKSSYSERAPSLAFTISGEPGKPGSAHVVWAEGTVSVTADELAQAAMLPARRSGGGAARGRPAESIDGAAAFLREALANGPRPMRDLVDEWANRFDGSKATLKRAKQAVGAEAFRAEPTGPWSWRLGGDPGSPPGDQNSPEAQNSPPGETNFELLEADKEKTVVSPRGSKFTPQETNFELLGNGPPPPAAPPPPSDDAGSDRIRVRI